MSERISANGACPATAFSPASPPIAATTLKSLRSTRWSPSSTFGSSSTIRIFSSMASRFSLRASAKLNCTYLANCPLVPRSGAVHFHPGGPASLKSFPIPSTVAEFSAHRFASRHRPLPVVGFLRRDMQKRATAFVALQVEIQERGNEMLVDRRDAILAPHRFLEILTRHKTAQHLRWRRISSDVMQRVFVHQHAAIGIHRFLKDRFDPVWKVRDVILVSGNNQQRNLDSGEAARVPHVVRRLFAPRSNRDDRSDFLAQLRRIRPASFCPRIKVAAWHQSASHRFLAVRRSTAGERA